MITFDGRWETDRRTPASTRCRVQRPIPIWIGGYVEATLRRVGQIGDGWFPWRAPNDDDARRDRARPRLRRARPAAIPAAIGLEPQLALARVAPGAWAEYVRGWQALGATHLCVNTMGAGYRALDEHVGALRRIREMVAP